MNSSAKRIRLDRFHYRGSRHGIIVPIDHGLTLGPVDGLKSLSQIASWIEHPGISGIIAHKGMIERLGNRGLLAGLGVMVHLNGMSAIAANPDRKERLTSLEAAASLGADAVSLQVNFDGSNDDHNLSTLGQVVDEAQAFGLPVLTMLYDKVDSGDDEKRLERLRHLMRITVELGTDAIKVAPPRDIAEIPFLLEGIADHTEVFFAGGSVCSEEQLLAMTKEALAAGAAGLCVGRNVFQKSSPRETLNRLRQLLQGASPHLTMGLANQKSEPWPKFVSGLLER
jgi:fructose-bisphosphate aldolase, class I